MLYSQLNREQPSKSLQGLSAIKLLDETSQPRTGLLLLYYSILLQKILPVKLPSRKIS